MPAFSKNFPMDFTKCVLSKVCVTLVEVRGGRGGGQIWGVWGASWPADTERLEIRDQRLLGRPVLVAWGRGGGAIPGPNFLGSQVQVAHLVA